MMSNEAAPATFVAFILPPDEAPSSSEGVRTGIGNVHPMRFRLSIKDILITVGLIAFLLGCITEGNRNPGVSFWLITAVILVVVLLSTAILGVIYRRGESQRFWVGVLTFGVVLLVVMVPSLEPTHYLCSELTAVAIFAYFGGAFARGMIPAGEEG